MSSRTDARGGRGALRAARWVLVPILVATLLLLPAFADAAPTQRATTSTVALPAASPATFASDVSAATAHAASTLSPPVRWVNVSGGPTALRPPGSDSGAMAYDPLDHETISFGGCTAVQCPENQTWAFSNGSWRNITNPYDAPPARYAEAMDFDANMGGLLLFGGINVLGIDLNDTWLFHAGAWTNLTRISPVAPSPRVYASMAFDPAPEENGSVLFGGYVGGVGPANDTWIWQGGAGWVLLSTSVSPPLSDNAQMAYDPAAGAVVLFGCGYGCLTRNQTWELYSGQWWQVTPPYPVPSYRNSADLTYDAALSDLVLFGGYGASGVLNDTWIFSNGVWTNITAYVGPAPPARWEAGMSVDSSAFPPLLFGGVNSLGNDDNDTWVLEVPPTVALDATPTVTETSVAVTLNVTMANGTAPFHALFEFGDGGSALAVSNTPTFAVIHAYPKAGTYVPSVNVTDAAGIPVASILVSGIDVHLGPSLGPLSEPSGGDLGIPISFTGAGVTNGTSPFTYLWRFGDGSSSAGVDSSHAYSATGTFRGSLTVTDALGANSSRPFTVLVQPLPSVTLGLSRATLVANDSTFFYGNVTGGTGPFRYAWNFGDGTTSSFAFPTHVFSAAGHYSVQLWVNDSVGGSAHAALAVSVGSGPHSAPPPSNTTASTGSAGVPAWFWPGLAGLIVGGVAGAVVLLRVGRPKS